MPPLGRSRPIPYLDILANTRPRLGVANVKALLQLIGRTWRGAVPWATNSEQARPWGRDSGPARTICPRTHTTNSVVSSLWTSDRLRTLTTANSWRTARESWRFAESELQFRRAKHSGIWGSRWLSLQEFKSSRCAAIWLKPPVSGFWPHLASSELVFRPEMQRILQLEAWHHPDLASGERPSQSETFRQLAEVLVEGDTILYHPSLPPNTHWRNWPDGGTL